MHLKLLQKESFKKKQKQMVIWLIKKIVNKILKVSKNSETVTNEYDKEIPKERYIYIFRKKKYWWTEIKLV